MAIYRPIYLLIWDDPYFEALRPYEKLIFVYLFGNPSTNESGVYPCTFKTIAKNTDVPIEIVEKSIREDLSEKIGYDDKNKVVWVKNFLKHNGKGNPLIIFRSILNDHKKVKSELWDEYWKYNAVKFTEYIMSNKTLKKDIETSKLFLPNLLIEALSNSNQRVGLLLGKSKVRVSKELDNSNPTVTNTKPKTASITNSSITNILRANSSNSNSSEEKDDEEKMQENIDAIIKISNELFTREGFEIDLNDFNARNMIGLRIFENGIEKISIAIKHAKDIYYNSDKMHQMCHWSKLFRDTTIKDLYTQANLGKPDHETDENLNQNKNEEMEVKKHEEEMESEKKENERYLSSSVPEKIDIVYKNLISYGPYRVLVEDKQNREKLDNRIAEFIGSNPTERSTVMISVNGIVNGLIDELNEESIGG